MISDFAVQTHSYSSQYLLKIVFDFANQIDDVLRSSLENMHIDVRIHGETTRETSEPFGTISKLNLDVTAMMAFVSSLTCEPCKWKFSQPILSNQAHQESLSSTKTFLDKLFQGKNGCILLDRLFYSVSS